MENDASETWKGRLRNLFTVQCSKNQLKGGRASKRSKRKQKTKKQQQSKKSIQKKRK